jgi:V8-like Glu-specific endopeptidase
MPRSCLVPILACLLAAPLASTAAAMEPASVIGEDSRRPLNGTAQTLARGIGFVWDSTAAYTCTAFCVADSVIATNAHCLLRRDKGLTQPNLSRIRFHMFDDHPAILAQSGAGEDEPTHDLASAQIAPIKVDRSIIRAGTDLRTGIAGQPATGLFHGDFSTNQNSPRHFDDWALAKLRNPLCKGRALKLEAIDKGALRETSNTANIYMIGYHGGRFEEGRSRSEDCELSAIRTRAFMRSQRRIFANAPNLLLHRCDMEQGASGSPIFLQTPDGPRVVALNSGTVSHLIYEIRHGSQRRRLVSRYDANTAVLSAAFIAGVDRFETETLLEDPERFRRLQMLLQARSYYTGPIDALYGPGTRGAIFRYEDERGLARLGVPTAELLADLEASADGRVEEESGGMTSGATPPDDQR